MRYAMNGVAYSGKSTLAQVLAAAGGYHYWCYTDYLKELCCTMLDAIGYTDPATGEPVTVESMHRNKDLERDWLISTSNRIGFDQPVWVQRFIDTRSKHQAPLYNSIPFNIAWDNVRFADQFSTLEHYGFVLVRLHVTHATQERRAAALGVTKSAEDWERFRAEPGEQPLPPQWAEIHLNGERDGQSLVDELERQQALLEAELIRQRRWGDLAGGPSPLRKGAGQWLHFCDSSLPASVRPIAQAIETGQIPSPDMLVS